MNDPRKDKSKLREMGWFHMVDTAQLDGIEEYAEYLEAILTGPCSVMEVDGELVLYEIKALVATIRGLKIEIRPKEHAPPHFHVLSGDVDASFAIEDCSLIRGKIDGFNQKKIEFWHSKAKHVLIDAWNSTRPTDCPVGPYRGN